MASLTKDLLRRDECQPLTPEQIADIKAQTVTRPKANVYIKPYEIMDLDGTEQVVGEVRKTIDGVKKKKPLYKKVIVGTTSNPAGSEVHISLGSGITDTSMLGLWIDNYDNGLCTDYATIISGGGDIEVWFSVSNNNVDFVLYADKRSDIVNKPFKSIVSYSKTTDSWEVV